MGKIAMHGRTVMAYDFDKYKDKRERVLGVKKRGMSFGIVAGVFSAVILLGLGALVVPKSIAYFKMRNLEDAIYKLHDAAAWPTGISAAVKELHGVHDVVMDENHARMVVTFDRTMMEPERLTVLFRERNLHPVLLNQVGHMHRMHLQEKEGAQ